jgi:hypothetical protein
MRKKIATRNRGEIVDASMRISVDEGKDCSSGGGKKGGKLIEDGKANRMFGDFSFLQF